MGVVSGRHSAMAVERSGFNSKGNWYESGDDGSYRYRNTDGGHYEYDGDGYGYYRNLRGTRYSEGRPYESNFDYNNGTREDIILSDEEDEDDTLIRQFEDFKVEDKHLDEEHYEGNGGRDDWGGYEAHSADDVHDGKNEDSQENFQGYAYEDCSRDVYEGGDDGRQDHQDDYQYQNDYENDYNNDEDFYDDYYDSDGY